MNSDGNKEDCFLVDRSLQALETIDWIHRTSSGSLQTRPEGGVAIHAPDLVLLVGDLNTEPGFLPYRVLTEIGSLIDTNGNFNIYHTLPKLLECNLISSFYTQKCYN